ncbi:hypothetical protein ACT009_17620 [Sphingomonas sp. Tas61C01]|uniref:hypothetical protein n=1 Tax=Sphingomonas sp. Tas61C01 TaxID=3458297 RepID=UPI00403E4D1D
MTRAILTCAVVAVTSILGACGQAPDRAAETATVSRTAPSPAPTTVAAAPKPMPSPTLSRISCATDIGADAAAKRVAICRNVSPATHPPCNVANSCAMIDDEIARSCALFDDSGCTPAPKSPAAAADVVRRYYAAINARDFATAWQMWGDDGRPGQSYDAFAAGFAHTKAVRVTIGPLEPGDAAMGSIYQPVPVTVDATLDDGTRQRFAGRYTVRRVNDVDGASSGQLRWHLGSADLRRSPPG